MTTFAQNIAYLQKSLSFKMPDGKKAKIMEIVEMVNDIGIKELDNDNEFIKQAQRIANEVQKYETSTTHKPVSSPVKTVAKVKLIKPEPKKRVAAKPAKLKVVTAPKTVKPKVTALKKVAKVMVKMTDEQKLSKLKANVEAKRKLVVDNAKFKDKLADEVKAYLSKKGLSTRVGLGNTADAMKMLRTKERFYSSLLSGDIQDFKTIGKRLGIIYRTSPIRKKK